MKINTVSVLGANGAMGCSVSAIFASLGKAKVYMVCRRAEAAQKAVDTARTLVKDQSLLDLIPITYDRLKECIAVSDLVFESVSENLAIKKEIYTIAAPFVKPGAIIATGTSGFSVNNLSGSYCEKFRNSFMGIHFFNPPSTLTLCELIPSDHTDPALVAEVKDYLKNVLKRDVVEVRDAPGFIGNRIGFQFINEAMQLAETFQALGGIDYIDSLIGEFSGRRLAPILTADFVGLDVHKAIVDNILLNTNDYLHDTFVLPAYVRELIDKNKLGDKKSGGGVYQTIKNPDGGRLSNVYEVVSRIYRPKVKYDFPFAKAMTEALQNENYEQAFSVLVNDKSREADFCLRFLIRHALYGIYISREIGENIHSADTAMVTGFNWVPPLAIVDALGGTEKFKILVCERLDDDFLNKIDIETLLKDIPPSQYDYRKFFKIKKKNPAS
ncbi:MAG: 3-hydroxyacyl-CoA dehydrogenase family protein [Desulfarculales bacterium]|jgi:3-hydroxyacyl-CoA dehydrogenase|nr:3-hydroxyacyl-CoA dehydrogenase family protein [Desulfarculales bacterium]